MADLLDELFDEYVEEMYRDKLRKDRAMMMRIGDKDDYEKLPADLDWKPLIIKDRYAQLLDVLTIALLVFLVVFAFGLMLIGAYEVFLR